MRTASVIFLTLFTLSSAGAAEQPAARADDLARRALDILGGGTAWQKARYISFTFKVEREGKVVSSFQQRLDRYSGDYRVSGKNPEGVPFEAVLNLKTKAIHGTKDGNPVTEKAQLEELFEIAYRRFINDTNWLLMPLEMFDPGVHRSSEGERTDSCGRTWDVVKLTFDPSRGFAPGDIYWFWINRDTGVVEEWDTKSGTAPDDPLLQVVMRDYRRVGGLMLSTRREVKNKNQTLRFDDLQVLAETPKDAFK